MEVNPDRLRKDLAALEAEETNVSAERRHLQRQIDFGFATETTRVREREVSDHRRQLHRRIDELRELLSMPSGPQQAPNEPRLGPITGHSSSGLERIGDR